MSEPDTDDEEQELKRYLVRTNCEYSIEVEARSRDGALDAAGMIPYENWGQSWAPYTAKETPYREPISGPGGVGRTDFLTVKEEGTTSPRGVHVPKKH